MIWQVRAYVGTSRSESESDTIFCAALCYRYLGGILALPGFWTGWKNGEHCHVAFRLCKMMVQVLQDLGTGVDIESELTQLEDYVGIDFLVDTILTNLALWLQKSDTPNRCRQTWHDKFLEVVGLVRRSVDNQIIPLQVLRGHRLHFEKKLPRSYLRAMSEPFTRLVAVVFEEVQDEVLVEVYVILKLPTGIIVNQQIEIIKTETLKIPLLSGGIHPILISK